MKDIKNILKTAVDKIKSSVEKKDIPLADAFAQMDMELKEAEKAYGKPLFPEDEKLAAPEEFYYKILGFKEPADFEKIKEHYEKLLKKFNPENFSNDMEMQAKAAKRINLINKAYQYFEKQEADKEH